MSGDHARNGSSTDTDSPSPASEPGAVSPGLFRGRAAFAAVAIGIGVIAAVVIVSLTTAGNDDPADAEVIAADDAIEPADPATAGTDPGATPDNATRQVDLGAAAAVGDFPVDLRTDPEGLVRIDLDDRNTPAVPNQAPQHCVLVSLSGPAQVETFGCVDNAANSPLTTLELSEPGAALVGCPAVATNTPAGDLSATPGMSSFLISESAPLPAGTYTLSVSAVTGAGDGCEPADGPTERVATTTAELTLG
ncbi:MAG: hypothetical protein ACK5O2_08280 [Microthrixaceae bacterium]